MSKDYNPGAAEDLDYLKGEDDDVEEVEVSEEQKGAWEHFLAQYGTGAS